MVTGDFVGSFTFVPRFQLGLRIPVQWLKGVGITDTGNNEPKGINAVGTGDPEVEGKFRLYGDLKSPFVIGGTVFATAPLGNAIQKDKYMGDKLPSVGVRAIFDGEAQGFSFGGNLAGVYRKPVVIGSTNLGSEFRYAVAGGYRVSPVFRVMAEAFGTTRFSTKAGENTMEGLLGLQIVPLSSPLQFTFGGGTGIIQGVGVPKVRGFSRRALRRRRQRRRRRRHRGRGRPMPHRAGRQRRLRGQRRLPRQRQRPRQHPRRAGQMPGSSRGHGRLSRHRRLSRARQRQGRHPRQPATAVRTSPRPRTATRTMTVVPTKPTPTTTACPTRATSA